MYREFTMHKAAGQQVLVRLFVFNCIAHILVMIHDDVTKKEVNEAYSLCVIKTVVEKNNKSEESMEEWE
jgi:hypothetical protein